MIDEARLLAQCLGTLESRGFSGTGRFCLEDLSCLQVALMVAALDGRILPREYEMFGRLAQLCPGATPEKIDAALDTALRSAGYLLLQSGRLRADALAALFADEALKILSGVFSPSAPERIRAAFGMWRTMAESDGDYSEIERQCLEALRLRVREVLKVRVLEELENSRYRRFGAAVEGGLEPLARSRVDEILP